ncbi:molybdenum cofactor biosynthesis protein A [bacterium BMS3Bbin14]|nr:molybdenum cofactor biosynthesis protein A [bacterium BMS3Abin13]GBE51584.1 molybdenum cofactor biosynthesis protein A [bacterium BMS3Bbin14]HDK43598.1 AmmeMemoRadiSam system radical SAM enzyme [Desulfobacteraceae bacterium]HDO30081.1 AmmeMemoRadiSam system radical SAM enzyme [Desulfobacteraceae bacterium]HDZ76322.1 AmmeMemoRadiSam system radical SAM enzyme [Desulfobacteraceae bacterium]
MKEAMFYQQGKGAEVICGLCSHRCHIKEGRRGICGVRENREGKLYTLVYGQLVSEHVDPIEKKPLFHLLPGSQSFSISTVGCNFRCLHCQNYQISQYPHLQGGQITGREKSAESVVDDAVGSGCASISYTYVEPTIFYEFAYDCAVLAHKRQLKNVFVSNGYMTPEVARHLAPVLDGINIDIKAFTDDFYKKVCKARLQPVLDNVQLMHELGVWVEVTTLIIPGLNDSTRELRELARFIKNVSPAVPWHVTAFYPTYKMMDRERTPIETLRKAREIGLAEGLRFVYEGNIPGGGGENTFCPACGATLITRFGFSVRQVNMTDGRCGKCGEQIEGVWQK